MDSMGLSVSGQMGQTSRLQRKQNSSGLHSCFNDGAEASSSASSHRLSVDARLANMAQAIEEMKTMLAQHQPNLATVNQAEISAKGTRQGSMDDDETVDGELCFLELNGETSPSSPLNPFFSNDFVASPCDARWNSRAEYTPRQSNLMTTAEQSKSAESKAHLFTNITNLGANISKRTHDGDADEPHRAKRQVTCPSGASTSKIHGTGFNPQSASTTRSLELTSESRRALETNESLKDDVINHTLLWAVATCSDFHMIDSRFTAEGREIPATVRMQAQGTSDKEWGPCYVLLPLSLSENHWAIGEVDRDQETKVFLDSETSPTRIPWNKTRFDKVVSEIYSDGGGKLKQKGCPEEVDGYDCGVITIVTGLRLICETDTKEEVDSNLWRKILLNLFGHSTPLLYGSDALRDSSFTVDPISSPGALELADSKSSVNASVGIEKCEDLVSRLIREHDHVVDQYETELYERLGQLQRIDKSLAEAESIFSNLLGGAGLETPRLEALLPILKANHEKALSWRRINTQRQAPWGPLTPLAEEISSSVQDFDTRLTAHYQCWKDRLDHLRLFTPRVETILQEVKNEKKLVGKRIASIEAEVDTLERQGSSIS